jgi:hypothetical protein
MLTSGGWLLVDWDTATVDPPKRYLWSLDPGDGSILGAYADATGVTPLPSMLEPYRIRWSGQGSSAQKLPGRTYRSGRSENDAMLAVRR